MPNQNDINKIKQNFMEGLQRRVTEARAKEGRVQEGIGSAIKKVAGFAGRTAKTSAKLNLKYGLNPISQGYLAHKVGKAVAKGVHKFFKAGVAHKYPDLAAKKTTEAKPEGMKHMKHIATPTAKGLTKIGGGAGKGKVHATGANAKHTTHHIVGKLMKHHRPK
jgi:hypothetical protein